MGEHAALTAGVERAQVGPDELALASHQRLAAAYERGFFDDLMTPLPRVDPRPELALRHHPRKARLAAHRVRHEGS